MNSMYMNDEGDLTSKGEGATALGLAIIAQAVHKRAKSKGWWETGERNMGEMIALMHSELSEALESYRNSEPNLHYKYPNYAPARFELEPQINDVLGKPEGLASEFADVIIRIMDTCEALEIPLTQALFGQARL